MNAMRDLTGSRCHGEARRGLGRRRRAALALWTLGLAVATLALGEPALPQAQTRALLAQAATAQVGVTLLYDPAYVRLAFPGGDVPPERGVCADVIVRAFRHIGVDLQMAVHEDMK